MTDYKIFLGVTVVVLTFVGYVPYIRDVVRNKTSPHAFTWFTWSFATAITYALQVSGGAGVGAWVTLAVAVISFFIFIAGLLKKSTHVTHSDFTFLVLALVALALWLIVKVPVWSVLLIVSVDIFGFFPTIRKSWNRPYSETLFSYELHTVRHVLSIFALQEYSIVTWLYPAAWSLANLIFSVLLIVRRKRINRL